MRAAIYARQSLHRSGEGLAVSRQLDACRDLAARNGWQVVEEYVDNDVSASSGKRVEWSRLLTDLGAGKHEVLVCWHTDRLYRRVRDLVDLVELAERQALRIASVRAADLDLSTPAGRMLAGMLGHAQRYEVEQKSARQVAANQQRARAGHMSWTRRPFGFDRVDGKVVVLEDEASLLRQATERILAGQSLSAIARDWNAAGASTSTGGAWSVTALRRAVLNPRVSGRVTYLGEDVSAGTWTAILTSAEQERLAALLRSPARRSQTSTQRKYLLSGALVCGKCGDRMFATPAGPKAVRYMAYRCRTAHLMRRLDLVDGIVVAAVVGRLARSDAAALLTPDVDLDELRREAGELRDRREELAQLLAEGLLTATAVRSQATGLKARLETIEAEIGAALGESVAAVLATSGDVRATWEAMPLGRQRQVVDELLTATLLPAGKGVRFEPEQVRVQWKSPT